MGLVVIKLVLPAFIYEVGCTGLPGLHDNQLMSIQLTSKNTINIKKTAQIEIIL